MNLLEWVRHFSLPHQSNNHKAKILHPSTLSAIVALFLISQFALNFSVLMAPSILGFASDITSEQVVELTNKKRAENGLAPLKINSLLNEAAQRKAGDMFTLNYWAHRSPSGRDPWSFFIEVGYKYFYAGENLARDFMNSGSAVEAWMDSPTHRDNILNNKYEEIGVAVVNGTLDGVETTLVVQLFGTPTPAPLVEKPVVPVSALTEIFPPSPELGETAVTEGKASMVKIAVAQAGEEEGVTPKLSPFLFTKTVAIFLLGIILGALVLDIVLVYKKKIVRLSGRNLAHLIFIGALLLAVILTTPGAIL